MSQINQQVVYFCRCEQVGCFVVVADFQGRAESTELELKESKNLKQLTFWLHGRTHTGKGRESEPALCIWPVTTGVST